MYPLEMTETNVDDVKDQESEKDANNHVVNKLHLFYDSANEV